MGIEKVHGLQTTGLSLNDRFTILQGATPERVLRPRKRGGFYQNQTSNIRNRILVDQITRRLEWQAKRNALRQRLGTLRHFGSEGNLPGLRRSNSFSNLSQTSVKNRISWRQPNGNLNRSWSFSNVAAGAWRGFRRRGGGQRALRGRFRGGGVWRQGVGKVTRVARRTRPQPTAARGRGRGGGRGRGRGAVRPQADKPVPTKEELDEELEQYMAGSKAALDKELETYMKNAMEME